MSAQPVTEQILTMDQLLVDLRRRQHQASEMGGEEGLRRHHASGRLSARERIDLLLDEGSWFEIGALVQPEMRREKPVPADAMITGFGKLDGNDVAVLAIDSSVLAGTSAPNGARKQGRLIDFAQRKGIPIVLLSDADGGRIPDVMGWRFVGFPIDFKYFGGRTDGGPQVPRAAAVLGPSYGDSALQACTAHFTVMVGFGSMALVSPSVIEPATGEKLTDRELGGPQVALTIGNAHMAVDTEAHAMEAITAFLSFMPPNGALPAPVTASRPPKRDPSELERIVPVVAKSGYDMRDVIEAIVDDESIFPWADAWGPSLVTCLARLEGNPVGIIANQPLVRAGALDADGMKKAVRFIDMCDAFNIPLIFLNDVPGVMVGAQSEQAGVLQCFEQMTKRVASAKVPKLTVLIRKAYGGGHLAMGGRPTHPDFQFAWPTAEIGFMAPEAGIATLHRRELEKVEAERGRDARTQRLQELEVEWTAVSEPWEAAANGWIDDIIEPGSTRTTLSRALNLAWGSNQRVAQ